VSSGVDSVSEALLEVCLRLSWTYGDIRTGLSSEDVLETLSTIMVDMMDRWRELENHGVSWLA
jgi:hypothetical protein